MGCHCKGQPYVHPAAVALDGGVDVSLHLAVIDNFVESAADLPFTHSKYRPVEVYVFPARKFGMEACSDFQQGCDSTFDPDLSGGGMGDPGEEFQECAFPGAVFTNDGHGLTLADGEVDILEAVHDISLSFHRPVVQLTHFEERVRFAHHAGHHAMEIATEGAGADLSKPIEFREVTDFDNVFHHEFR